jgi:hypothetical protein
MLYPPPPAPLLGAVPAPLFGAVPAPLLGVAGDGVDGPGVSPGTV